METGTITLFDTTSDELEVGQVIEFEGQRWWITAKPNLTTIEVMREPELGQEKGESVWWIILLAALLLLLGKMLL